MSDIQRAWESWHNERAGGAVWDADAVCECCGAADDIRLAGETLLCPDCPSVYGRCPCGAVGGGTSC